MDQTSPAFTLAGPRVTVRALSLCERLNTAGLERADVLSTSPLSFRVGAGGVAVLFRYGVVVLAGLSALEETSFLESLQARMIGVFARREDESAVVEMSADREDQIPPGGPIVVHSITPERLVVIAEALAKSVVLARDEREVAAVFDIVEPYARELAKNGRMRGGRRAILKRIGNALLVRYRVLGNVAVADKPDVLWDRPYLERLYARLEDEYELKERADALSRKLAVIAETAQVLTDIIDTQRSLRLEVIVVLLILFEVVITIFQLAIGRVG
ncbi:MAG: RMD1 family protein [Xanthobacteraceae bacterium]